MESLNSFAKTLKYFCIHEKIVLDSLIHRRYAPDAEARDCTRPTDEGALAALAVELGVLAAASVRPELALRVIAIDDMVGNINRG
jgi:hypothetical protein